ncbi:MAG: Gfo/Idh/MocA family oxidoreductase [Clostridia bacterium]|nr:Gfo/Idh/MocA family oxidoreductase [Clostridia bacterium]
MSKLCTVAILGVGSRGHCYGKHMFSMPDKYKIVSICEIKPERLARFEKEWGIAKDLCFTDADEFLKEKRADVLVIGTHDREHVAYAIKALELGYHILLEKPISPVKQEMLDLLEAQKKHPQKVLVCHVLRYSPVFVKLKELVDKKEIGDLRIIEWNEQVAFWHQCHSFVRGNWRRDEKASPMIMQKCCHDLDLLQYYVGDKCDTVYSTGDLSFFKREFQPEGAADRCSECKYINTCPFSAEWVYVTRWRDEKGSPADQWPFNMCCYDIPLTEEKIRKAYSSPDNVYGRCVFACDNTVVDNQMVTMKFKNGVKVNLTMSAFSADSGRRAIFRGTNGQINFDESEDVIRVQQFGKEPYFIKGSELCAEDKTGFGHGGGDVVLVETLYDMIYNGAEEVTALEASVESHLIALCAEESRQSGKVIKVHED